VFVRAPELLAGVALDLILGDPQGLPHPIRGLGWLIGRVEILMRRTRLPLRLAGILLLLIVTSIFAAFVGSTSILGGSLARIYWIYALLACRDLDTEASRVIRALDRRDIVSARRNLSWIVGRDTEILGEPEIVRATLETVAENLSDAVVAPLFFLAIAGPVGMATYKAVNTLDSMVGYRDERYREFGWASARLDDVLNFIPARLTAALIWCVALLPGFDARRAIRVTVRDGANQPSPNSGYPEAAVAGAIGVQLGGTNFYRGEPSYKKTLGDPVHALQRSVYPRVRLLLYGAEALCVACIAGGAQWR
jgi:adenosylcobinamide-phosphate synthase